MQLWSSDTAGKAVSQAVMQSDGNFVCYSASGAPAWATGTNGNPGAYLLLEDDGNLAVFSAANVALWSSSTAQPDLTPSTIAARAITTVLYTAAPGSTYFTTPRTPGWAFKLRYNGAAFADAPNGWARVPGSSPGLAMTNQTIIHAASMSKPVCVTAYVAMRGDWNDLASGVAGLGPLAGLISVGLTLSPATGPFGLPQPHGPVVQVIQAPIWLAPALSSGQANLQRWIAAGMLRYAPAAIAAAVRDVASGRLAVQTPVSAPPGYPAFLTAVLAGKWSAPAPGDTMFDLIGGKLREKATSLGIAWVPGAGIGAIKIQDLILHASTLRDGIIDKSWLTRIPAAGNIQPSDGSHATSDVWAYLLAELGQPADGSGGYKNDDYTVLGALVSACAGMDYDDYVQARLFSDPRFSALRRYVVDASHSAWYYGGLGPFLTGGHPFPDYRGWGAAGGFYYTADQITDWLYVLYSGQTVQRPTWAGFAGPLVSAAGHAELFGTSAHFAAGQTNTINGAPGWTTYTHNGGVDFGAGGCNGDLGIAVSASGAVITGYFCANGQVDANAAFDTGLAAAVAGM